MSLCLLDSSPMSSAYSKSSRIEVSVRLMPLFSSLVISVISQSIARTNRNGESIHQCFTLDAEAVCQVAVTGDLALDVCVEYLDHTYHLLWDPIVT